MGSASSLEPPLRLERALCHPGVGVGFSSYSNEAHQDCAALKTLVKVATLSCLRSPSGSFQRHLASRACC